jgi:hypothetical protein
LTWCHQGRLVVAQLTTRNGGALRVEDGGEVDDFLKDSAAYCSPNAVNMPTIRSATPPTAL